MRQTDGTRCAAAFRERAWIVLGCFAALTLGCSRAAVNECTKLLESERYEEAAVRCEEDYAVTGDARAGLAAARALEHLGRQEEALVRVERLAGSSEAAAAQRLAAALHRQLGNLDQARQAYRRHIESDQAAGNHEDAARGHFALWQMAYAAGELGEALDFARGVFEETSKAGQPAMQVIALETLYSTFYDVGDLDAAQWALVAAEPLIAPEVAAPRARRSVHQGLLHVERGRPALARAAFEEALELAAGAIEDATFFRSVHLNLVKTHLALGDLEAARRHLEAAWEHAGQGRATALHFFGAQVEHARGRHAEAARAVRQALDEETAPSWIWELETLRGRVSEDLGDAAAAALAYRRATEVVEEMRRALPSDEFKAWLLDQKRKPFEALFRLQARSGQADDALGTLERAKARAFLDAFIQATTAPAGVKAEPATPDLEMRTARDRLAGLEALVAPMSASPVVAPRPLAESLATLAERHVLIYFQAGEELWLVTVADRRTRLRQLAVAPREVETLVDEVLARPDETAAAERLGEILLPRGVLPRPGTPLFLVTDSELGRLPFAALRSRDRYLVEDHDLVYVPSLSALAALVELPGSAYDAPRVLADPAGDLPAAASEAREVGARLGVEPWTSAAATVAELRGAARARVLHLATHTGLGSRGPWLSLADGEVGAGAIVAGPLQPRLVVLASCASAVRRTKGMWGSLGAAFLAAGSRAVLASLWSLEDQATRELILRFYDEGGAEDPVGALARTQRAFLAEGRPPSFWAPFVIFGSDLNRND